ncbi:DNA methylase [Halanaerobium congolense]|uniref:DNA methylase n=1 Tax=Halanaerobium congolense TaxID=54121 RepID=A0A1M7MQC6_9FIRM|nr:DNA methyltransferase [Halanaerobium congolense]PTX17336.1 DNA methylase [Halanaerobium congolense]SDF84542.1 DNA methylase [Halanaerobium congolense]SET12571.1 DNA methylase [Halanaerobium congolense]SFP54175.1 DNA methylase [Halanaerobium congolense]SHM93221.1 DNA methylase [Halanaerobium congolense]
MNKEDIKPLEELLDEVRDIDGFPIADDEDILKLSDPPYYTACPNPYINDFIKKHGTPYDPETDDYEIKPFVGDVSEGKTDPVYMAHTYHTKVPHKAIEKFIEHYTEKNDIIFDGFCGSGMTGVAAQNLNRNIILSDLAPAATFISYNFNKKSTNNIQKIANQIIEKTYDECKWLYETTSKEKSNQMSLNDELESGEIQYVIWSDIYRCPYCEQEYVFWDEAVNSETKTVKKKFECPHCNAEIKKRNSEPVIETKLDSALGKEVQQTKQIPVYIDYKYKGNRYNKKPDEDDLDLIEKINSREIPEWFPANEMPDGDNTIQPKKSNGFTHVHHFFTKRNLWVLSELFNNIEQSNLNTSQKNSVKLYFTSIIQRASKLFRWNKNQAGPLTGTLYVASMYFETSIFSLLRNKSHIFNSIDINNYNNLLTTQSITDFNNIESNSIDYIFTDPPFGDNLMYSELNYIWESWLKVFTNNETEAIVNKTQNKELEEYTYLMTEGFKEMYKILKPNRWMTVVFHNSKAKVWNAIQESITRAGFIIAQVSTLDKKQGSFKQVTTAGSVKNDLVINAYKPKKEFEDKFLKNAGEGLEADFVKEQLKHLPVEANIERTEQMLYSKMLAHYVENGFKIKYDANNFYKLLHDNFVELDGYWFLDDQAEEYSEWKSSLKLNEIEDIKKGNQVLFVVDEKSALTWINNFLDEPKDYGEIYTSYEQIATQTDDKIPELRELLDQNFILEDGKYRRPKTRKERESIEKSRTKNLERAWKKLLDRAKNGSRKIKNIRKEALIHGFTKCYQQENYEDIVTVADRLYKSTLESSGDILDFVDIARMKTE